MVAFNRHVAIISTCVTNSRLIVAERTGLASVSGRCMMNVTTDVSQGSRHRFSESGAELHPQRTLSTKVSPHRRVSCPRNDCQLLSIVRCRDFGGLLRRGDDKR